MSEIIEITMEEQIDEMFDESFDLERQVLKDGIAAVRTGDRHKMTLARHSITSVFAYNVRVTVRQINLAAKITDMTL